MRDDDNDLPESLRDATGLLREPPTVRAAWQRETEARVAADARSWTRRRWAVSPIVAMAAGVTCIAMGALAAGIMQTRTQASAPIVAARIEPARVEPAAPAATVRFDLVAPGASRVSIAGDFNQWSAESLPMRRAVDGRTWEIEIPLPPGRYTYGFIVDGRLTRDPSAPQTARDDYGVANSVRLVSQAGGSL